MDYKNLPPHLRKLDPPLTSMERKRYEFLHNLIQQAQEPDKQLYIRMYYSEMGLILLGRDPLVGKTYNEIR